MFGEHSTKISISTGTMIRAVLVGLGVYLFWFLRDILMVIFTSIIVASFVESTIPYFKKVRIGRLWGVVIFYVVGLLIFAGLFYLFAPLLITEIYNFSNFLASYVPGFDFLEYFQSKEFAGAKDAVTKLSDNLSVASLLEISRSFIENLSSGFLQTLAAAFGSIFNFVLIIIISFYLSVQEKGIENFLRIILPVSVEEYVVDLWYRSQKKIAYWIKGQMFLGLLVAVLTYIVLSILGIQYALLLAIIAGLMELVPYGVILALVPAASFSYLSGGISSALLVAGAYVIIHQFEVFLFTPLIVNRVVGLSPLVVILSVLVGFELAGIWGMVLAIPAAVILMEILNDVEKRKIMLRGTKEESKK
ncbi:MAG: AI-2E family transporter [Candidatus Paceibacterota bacterium]